MTLTLNERMCIFEEELKKEREEVKSMDPQPIVGMPEIIVPESDEKLDRQIKALEAVLKVDTNEKDRAIHQAALDKLLVERERRRG